MKSLIEILVHVSGPSRGRDDARYRRQAWGLVDFEPVNRHDILLLYEKRSDIHQDCDQESIVQTTDVTSIQAPEGFADELFSDIGEDTAPCGAKTVNPGASRSVDSVPSVQDANKNNAMVPRTATKQKPQLLIERTPALPRCHTTTAVVTAATDGLFHRRTRSDSWKTPPRVIPDSQPTLSSVNRPEISSSPCLKRPFGPSSSPSLTHEDDLPSYKRRRVQETSVARSAPRESVSLDRTQVKSPPIKAAQETWPPNLTAAPSVAVHAPRPQPSKARFETHLTPSLQILSTQLPLERYFKPSVHVRIPEKLERGHWSIPIQSWGKDLKIRFWQFLTRFVEEGRAGWGVWCSREFQGDMQFAESSKENNDPNAREEVVRVYCWGEIIGELWLLLFIASERQIKGVGARWNDARKATVVKMA